MAVVLYHLSGNLKEELSAVAPGWFITITSYGYLGVPVFFVLSGFVITASTKSYGVTLGYFGRFALKRSLRLDPPYWAAIGLASVFLITKRELGFDITTPDAKNYMAHAFYLQDILDINPKINVVFWTLCLEIQFYLFFVLSILVTSKISEKSGLVNEVFVNVFSFFLVITGLVSLLVYSDYLAMESNGWFIPYWHFFVLGSLTYKATCKKGVHVFCLIVFLILEVGTVVYSDEDAYMAAAISTSIFISFMATINKLQNGLSWAPLQFLGAISYSLYLTHPDIGWKTISIVKLIFPEEVHGYLSFLVYTLGVISSIFFAYVFYIVIERSSHKLSRRIVIKK